MGKPEWSGGESHATQHNPSGGTGPILPRYDRDTLHASQLRGRLGSRRSWFYGRTRALHLVAGRSHRWPRTEADRQLPTRQNAPARGGRQLTTVARDARVDRRTCIALSDGAIGQRPRPGRHRTRRRDLLRERRDWRRSHQQRGGCSDPEPSARLLPDRGLGAQRAGTQSAVRLGRRWPIGLFGGANGEQNAERQRWRHRPND